MIFSYTLIHTANGIITPKSLSLQVVDGLPNDPEDILDHIADLLIEEYRPRCNDKERYEINNLIAEDLKASRTIMLYINPAIKEVLDEDDYFEIPN